MSAAERVEVKADHRQFIRAARQRVRRAEAEVARREDARAPMSRVHEAALRAAVEQGSTTLPPRLAHDLGPCFAPGCPRTAVRITPTHKLRVCDEHYGPQSSSDAASTTSHCHCGERSLFDDGSHGAQCSNHIAAGQQALVRIIERKGRL